MPPFPPLRHPAAAALAVILGVASIRTGANDASPDTVDYLRDVKPVLTRHCVACHADEPTPKAGLNLQTARAALLGGDSGPAIVPGKPAESLLVQVLHDTHPSVPRMPYKKPALEPRAIQALEQWIAAGAPVPTRETPGRHVHWAFITPSRPTVPQPPPPPAPGLPPARNPIDAFIRERLQRDGLLPSPEADRVTLLRRLHLDLTGLPPSPREVAAFLADSRPDAYETRVEALLQSPHHAERWARWWLDVARYADSNGYSIDAPRSIWPWRDWVIRAFADDKPFDTFIVEQLAGDLLPDASLDQRIATGFHRNTQINQEGGIDPEQFRIESVIDRVNTTGTAFLGLTVACAQCHDHKFDPISQKEYFQLFAFLNDQDEPTLPIPTDAQKDAIAEYQRQLRELNEALAALPKPDAPDATPDAKQERTRLETRRRQLERNRPAADSTLVLTERAEPRESYVFIKGDFTRRGPDVSPGTPAVLHPAGFPAGQRPNRLHLARWLVDPANPLTARVVVNRVWQQYFGRGLVETENDFGTQGTPPSHPALLDWLATELVERDWSLRAIHRLVVTSSTYRQSSRHRPDLLETDADNRLLARQHRLRLDAEVIRDVALAVSGKLNPAIGGPGVFPPQPDGVMNLGQSSREWKPSAGPDRFRRGLYTFFWRATPHPALTVFDAPDAFSTCTRRLRSNTPLQALTLLNDAAFSELARALADRVTREAPASTRLDYAFQLCLARLPSHAERARLNRLIADETRDHGETAAWQTAARVLLNLDETITRE